MNCSRSGLRIGLAGIDARQRIRPLNLSGHGLPALSGLPIVPRRLHPRYVVALMPAELVGIAVMPIVPHNSDAVSKCARIRPNRASTQSMNVKVSSKIESFESLSKFD